MNTTTYTMRDLVEYYIGGGWGKEEQEKGYPESAYVIRGTDMPDLKLAIASEVPHRYHKSSNLRSRRLQAGDIVMEVSGGSKDQPVGRSLLITPTLMSEFDDDVMCASFCKLIRPNADLVDPAYLYWHLQHIYDNREIVQYQVQSTGISNFKFEPFLDQHEVELPPKPVQRRIAGILSAYDDLIENNTRRIRLLEEMARALYREWFVHYRFPGHEEVAMVEHDELEAVPEGWDVLPSSAVIDINPRTKVPKEGMKPYLPMGSLSETSMLISDVEERTGNSGAKFRNGDTLFARITPSLENGKTGFVQFLPTPESVAFGSTEFIVLRSKSVSPYFVYLLARTDEFRENAILSMAGASGRQRVRNECFDAFLIARPTAGVLSRFDSVVAPMFELVQTLARENDTLRETRDLLLPRLVSGALPVEAAEEELEAAA